MPALVPSKGMHRYPTSADGIGDDDHAGLFINPGGRGGTPKHGGLGRHWLDVALVADRSFMALICPRMSTTVHLCLSLKIVWMVRC